jgi:lactate dehydrogenase-like 2-hydroxyacid dehydrogenase
MPYKKPKIFITRKIPEPGLDRLAEFFDVKIYPDDKVLSKKDIINCIWDVAALLCLLTDTIDQEIIASADKLKVISNYAVGYNNIDVEYATQRKIPVCNTPGVLTESTADFAWTLLLSAARRIPEADKFIRAGKFTGWSPMMFLGRDVYGKTIGIIGAGRIGQAVAKRATGFNMKILYSDTAPQPEFEKEIDATFVPIEQLLEESDFISIHVPLTESTKHLIGKPELKLMKNSSILVNTSRGSVVDEKALTHALKTGEIGYAGLDVFENEPELTPGLKERPNSVLVPHLGSATIEARTNMALLAAENAIAVVTGKKPPHIVNPEVFK